MYADEYAQFADKLAESDMLVVIPELTVRVIASKALQEFINESIADGFQCTRNGNFVSAQSEKAVYDWIEDNPLGNRTRRDVILVGHSFGGLAVSYIILGVCSSEENFLPFFFDTVCDGFNSTTISTWDIKLSVSFEGGAGGIISAPPIPPWHLFTHVFSPFYERQANILRSTLQGGNRFVDIPLRSQTNHFAINNYAVETGHARTVCARPREGREAFFQSTRCIQGKLVNSMAQIVTRMWQAIDDILERYDDGCFCSNYGGKCQQKAALNSIGVKQLFKVRNAVSL